MRRVPKAWQLAIALTLLAATAKTQGAYQSPLLAPSGEYKVGRTHFEWIDNSREESENRGHRREVIVWVWYPASPKSADAETAEWMPGKWGEYFSSIFVADHPDAASDAKEHPIRSIRTHAYADAPAASAKHPFPVLLFAPGLGSTPLDYGSLIEDVVSHGYIVAAIVPTYYARVSLFSDGRVIEGLDIRAIQAGPGGRGPRTVEHALQRMQEVVEVWSNDLSFTLKQLEKVNADAQSPLKEHFDFGRIGAIGHSMGGAAVLQVGHDDARVRAVFDIDGSPIWNGANGPLAKPLLILSAASTPDSYDTVPGGAKPGMHLRLAGSTHPFSKDFLLVPLISQHPSNTNRGRPQAAPTIDPKRAIKITQAYIEAFFDRYLNGQTVALLKGPSPEYPEIMFERGSEK
jgi:dienelactone hydrolase